MNIKLYEAVDYKNYEKVISEDLYEYLIGLDPTEEKGYKYANWIIQKVLAFAKSQHLESTNRDLINSVRWSLVEKDFKEIGMYTGLQALHVQLSAYDEEMKKKTFPPRYKNIFDFKTLESFLLFMKKEFEAIVEKSKEKEAFKDSTIIYKDENKILIIPKTKYSAWYFGQDTDWCTSRQGSDSYFNQYKEAGTMFIYAIFDETKGRYDGRIQIFIPNSNDRLAECRDSRDRTIYSAKLFRQFDDATISKLRAEWESLSDSNTDQWDEGTGYLDPDVLRPEDEDEDEELELIGETFLYINEDDGEIDEEGGFRITYTLDLMFRQYEIDRDGEIVGDMDTRTTQREETSLRIYKGKDFFKMENPLAMEILKNMVDPKVIGEDDDFKLIPELLSFSQVHYFDEGNYPISILRNESFSSVIDDIDDETTYRFMDDFGVVFTICDRKFVTGEDVYSLFDLNKECIIKCRTANEIAFDIKFENRDLTIILNIIENSRSIGDRQDYPKFMDSKLAKFAKGELDFIRDDKREAKHGQQFMNYEHRKLMNYLNKFYEKRKYINSTESKKLIK